MQWLTTWRKSNNPLINNTLITVFHFAFYPPAAGGEQLQLVGLVPQDSQVVPRLQKVQSWRTLPQVNLRFFPCPSQGHIFFGLEFVPVLMSHVWIRTQRAPIASSRATSLFCSAESSRNDCDKWNGTILRR